MDDPSRDDSPHEQGGGHSFYQNFQHTPIGARIPERIGRGVFSTGLMILQTSELFVLDFLSMGAPPPQVVSRVIMVAPHYAQFVAALRSNIEHYESQFGAIRSHGPTGLGGGAAINPPNVPLGEPESHGGHDHGETGGGFFHPSGGPNDPSTPWSPNTGGGEPSDSASAEHASAPRSMHPPEAVTDLYQQVKFPEELLPGSFSDAVMIRHSPEEFSFDFICTLYPRPIVVSRIYFASGRARGVLETVSGALDRFRRFGPPPPPSPQSE